MKRILIPAALLTATLLAWGQTRKVNESWTMTAHDYQAGRCTFIWFARGAATLKVTTVCAPHTMLNVGDVVEPIVGIMTDQKEWDVYAESEDAVFVNVKTHARETFRFVKQEVVKDPQ
jgi:hypothetical protein